MVPEGSKDVPVGQPIAIMVMCDKPLTTDFFVAFGESHTHFSFINYFSVIYWKSCQHCEQPFNHAKNANFLFLYAFSLLDTLNL